MKLSVFSIVELDDDCDCDGDCRDDGPCPGTIIGGDWIDCSNRHADDETGSSKVDTNIKKSAEIPTSNLRK